MKTKDLINLELFGGIMGFTKGFEQAGWTFKKTYYSEIDKHAIAVVNHKFKNIINEGSIKNINPSKLPKIDIITFGSPCQDFSIAGDQEGLQGKRSSLIKHAIKLIDAKRPSLFVWENVKGAYSSNQGRDFQAILQAFANLGGYRLEWQLLNTDWVLPQNRERIYLVGHLAGKSYPGVFPFCENNKIFTKKNKPRKGQPQTQNSTTISAQGYMRADETYIELPKKAATLTNGGNSGGYHSDMTTIPVVTPDRKNKRQNGPRAKEAGETSHTLTAQDRHGVFIKSATKKGFEVAKEGDTVNFKQPNSKTRRGRVGKQKANTLETDSNQAVLMKENYIQWDRTDNKVNIITNDMKLRRLTEIECERLQGFPDNWTQYGVYDGKVKEVAKTNRYKLIGNAVTVDVVQLIAERLKKCIIK